MTTADGRGKSRRDTLLPIILCLCFIGSSIIFLVQMILKSQKENVAYLYDAANQTRTSILKQIEGDWQTLEGLAVSLRELVILDENQILTILNDINEENAFIRMGYADINGNARMVDMEGNVEEVNLKGMDFFERALQGEKSISNTFADQQDASGYINYFGVRINDGSGNARGVLCAVHSAVVLREIIDAPVLKGAGYSNILDANGHKRHRQGGFHTYGQTGSQADAGNPSHHRGAMVPGEYGSCECAAFQLHPDSMGYHDYHCGCLQPVYMADEQTAEDGCEQSEDADGTGLQ